jgi:hypothetical protein
MRTIDARMGNGLTALKTVPVWRIFFVTEHRLSIVSEISSAHLTFDLLWSFRCAEGNEIEMTTLNMFGQDRRLSFATVRAVEESFIQSFVTAILAPQNKHRHLSCSRPKTQLNRGGRAERQATPLNQHRGRRGLW